MPDHDGLSLHGHCQIDKLTFCFVLHPYAAVHHQVMFTRVQFKGVASEVEVVYMMHNELATIVHNCIKYYLHRCVL